MDSVSGVFVPVEALAEEQGITADEVVQRIQSGQLTGRQQDGTWHVLVRVPPQAAAPAAPAGGRVVANLDGPVHLAGRPDVVVRDLHIGLLSLTGLILKFAVASIIAGIILGGIGFGVMLLVESYGQGLINTIMEVVGPYLPS